MVDTHCSAALQSFKPAGNACRPCCRHRCGTRRRPPRGRPQPANRGNDAAPAASSITIPPPWRCNMLGPAGPPAGGCRPGLSSRPEMISTSAPRLHVGQSGLDQREQCLEALLHGRQVAVQLHGPPSTEPAVRDQPTRTAPSRRSSAGRDAEQRQSSFCGEPSRPGSTPPNALIAQPPHSVPDRHSSAWVAATTSSGGLRVFGGQLQSATWAALQTRPTGGGDDRRLGEAAEVGEHRSLSRVAVVVALWSHPSSRSCRRRRCRRR